MRVPLSWLNEFVAVDLTPEQLADRLTLLGMEVSAIEHIGSDWHRIVVGELLEVAPHPKSGKLSMTRVHVGDGEPELSIVCGATNIEAGQHVPVALPGSVLPGDRRIDVSSIAGVESQGMICSGDELGLTTDADGILILPPESKVGTDLVEIAGDIVLDIDVKPNRGDALSILGLAREVAAATRTPLIWPDLEVEESGDASSDHIGVVVEEPGLCTRFVGRYVEGVTIRPAPWEVQRRLIAAGVRPISNVVDTSNYVMLELGKPVHTFDAAAVKDGRISVRLAQPGERLETLDHVQRELTTDTLLISGTKGPLALAGVMGGADSEIAEQTTDIIIESAIFDPVSVRRTAFRFGLRSEASLRFEKGQEYRMARLGADRTASLITRWAGGRAAVGAVDSNPDPPPAVRVPFRPWRIDRLLGEMVPVAEQRELLARVEVATQPAEATDLVPIIVGEDPLSADLNGTSEALVAVVPGHRRDLIIEADIAEEIARVRGYETLLGRLPDTEMPPYQADPRAFFDRLRETLAGSGLTEILTHGLISPDDHAHMGHADDPATIRATNPVTIDHSELRRSMVPGHLHVLVDNERQRHPTMHAFELGAVHEWVDGDAVEADLLAITLSGSELPVAHDRAGAAADVATVKGLLERLASRLLSCRLVYAEIGVREGVEHPGRTAAVVAVSEDGTRTVIGRVGELHPRLLGSYEVRAEHVVFAEIDLVAAAGIVPQRRRIGRTEHLPGVERDLAIVVATTCPAGDVEAIIRAHGGDRLRDVRLFDLYQGPPLADDEKSLAYRLRFESIDGAVAEAEMESSVEAVLGRLEHDLGARLRA
jgi:phenylalanyl-tRNA synthetase beta chain